MDDFEEVPNGPHDPHDGQTEEEDLWFLPGPVEEEPDYLPPLPRTEPSERDQIAAWEKAEAGQAVRLARVAARLGALDDRLLRGPAGWKHRLALIEASELSWLTGDRVSVDRLGLWVAMRMSAAQDDTAALRRTAWAFRRLASGPGPGAGLSGFLGRHEAPGDTALAERLDAWDGLMAAAAHLHPITRAGFARHLWPLAGIGPEGDLLEGAVIAARIAADEGQGGAIFGPVAMGGAGGLCRGGSPDERLARWLDGMEQAARIATRLIDRIETWHGQAIAATRALSGRTPPRLIEALRDWPLVSAPMAGQLTGASRAAVQRNLAWMQERGLVVEVTGQGRFRMWRGSVAKLQDFHFGRFCSNICF